MTKNSPSIKGAQGMRGLLIFVAGAASTLATTIWWLWDEDSLRSVAFAPGLSESLAEDVQTLILLIGMIFLIRLAVALNGRQRLAFFVAAAFMLLLVLEEIAWGQHLFGWNTPSAIAEVNAQDETTLHNLVWFQDYYFVLNRFNLLFALPALGGLFLGLVWIVLPLKYQKFFPGWESAPFFLFASAVHWAYAINQSSLGPIVRRSSLEVGDWEIAEVFLYLGLLSWIVLLRSRFSPSKQRCSTIRVE